MEKRGEREREAQPTNYALVAQESRRGLFPFIFLHDHGAINTTGVFDVKTAN